MSKIVCDVCGSTYSETEAQCPICGTAKSEAAKPIVEANAEEQTAKGGKYSRPNPGKSCTGSPRKSGSDKNKEEGAPSNLAMIIIVGVLLLAIVSVCVFIAVRLINRPNQPDPSGSSSSIPPVVQTIPCTGIELVGNPDSSLSFTDLTQTAQLNVKAKPENTTDTVTYTYSSSDPTVVTVDDTGLVTPVAEGTATITISYGSYSISVAVSCEIPQPVVLTLKHSDVTLRAPGSLTVNLYDGELDPADITWTSSDVAVATVENGVVTAVGNGTATITATYGDQTATCKVIVKDIGENTDYEVASKWGASDVTLQVGQAFEFFLANKATGEKVTENVEWIPSDDFSKCCTMEATEDGIKITANESTSDVAGKFVYIEAKYNGQIYKLIVRVKAAAAEG